MNRGDRRELIFMDDEVLNYMGVEPDQDEKQGKLAVRERGEPDRH